MPRIATAWCCAGVLDDPSDRRSVDADLGSLAVDLDAAGGGIAVLSALVLLMAMPRLSAAALMFLSGSIALVYAVISWHVIEKPALSLVTGSVTTVRRVWVRPPTPGNQG